jgi:outer membrane protein assembly factor BamB
LLGDQILGDEGPAGSFDDQATTEEPMRSHCHLYVIATTRAAGSRRLAALCWLMGLVLVAVLGWTLAPTLAFAQNDDADGDEQAAFGLYPPVPRELRRPLNRAKQAIESGEFAEATAELGKILDSDDQQDYFFGDRRNAEKTSLRTESMRLLGSIPPSDRRAYELQFGTSARKLVEHALANDSPEELAEASRRYFHTDAGYEATVLLGRHFFTRGEPGAAAAAFARVYEVEGARERFEPSLSLLLATSYLFSDQKDRARTIMSDLKQRFPKAKTEVGGKNALVFEDDGDPLARLVAWVGESEQTAGAADSWLLHRGSSTRTGVVENAEPHPVSLWSLPTAETPLELQVAAERRRELTKSGTSTTTVLSPLIVGDWVICRNVDGLIGVDRRTGRRVWKFPADDLATDQSPVAMGRNKGIDSQKQFVRQRIWDDAPYGQISSDGRAIYVVDGLGFSGFGAYRQGRNPFMFNADFGTESRNRLVALDVQREGKQIWVAGDSDEADSPLANAFFLGAPIPVHGTLYALADIKGEVALVALDAASGQFKWKQQVAQRDATMFRREETQRLGGCSPSFSDGLLICPTALGCVVAVDPSTRTLKWEFRYQRSNENDNNRAFSPIPPPLLPLERRWQENVILMPGKNIVLELVDSPNLYVLDRETGKVQWNRLREDDHWVAATDKLVLTGGKSSQNGVGRIRAWKLEDGTAAWEPLSLGSSSKVATGRGLANVARDTWYQPMSGREIWCISLAQGTVQKVIRLESDVGSLAVAGPTLISQSPESIDCFMLSAAVQSEIESLSSSNPKSPWAAARRAELDLVRGDAESAWRILSEFSTENPPPALRAVLLRTMTALLRKDFSKWESLVEKARSLVASSADEHRFLDAYSEGIVQQGKASDVVVALLEYSRSLTDNSYAMSAELVERTDDWAVQRSRWIAARLDRFYQSASVEDRKLIEQSVSQVVDRLLDQDPPVESLRVWSQLVAFHPASGAIRLRLAKSMLAGDDYLFVEQTLLPIVLDPKTGMLPTPQSDLVVGLYSREQQVAAWALLASAYERSNRLAAAATAYDYLASHGGDIALPTGEPAGEWARLALSSEKFGKQEMPNAWNGSITSEIRTGVSKESRISRMKPPYFAPIHQATSAAMSRGKVAWDADTVVMLDSLGRETFATSWGKRVPSSIRPEKNVSQARVYGHTLLLSFGTEIVAFDTMRPGGRDGSETSLWRDDTYHRPSVNTIEKITTVTYANAWDTQPRSAATTSSRHLIGAISQITPWGIVYLQEDTLICREIVSGEIIWKRTGLSRGSDLLSTSSRVVCCPPDSNQARTFSLIDGSELAAIDVPPIERRMVASGSNLLSWKKEDDKVSLELRSLETAQPLLNYSTETRARGYVIDQREIAIATAEGKLTIHSLADGAELLAADIEPDDKLQKLYVMKSNSGYLAIVVTNTARSAPGFQFGPPDRTAEPLSTARIYAFDTAGKSQWARAARVSQQSFSMNQPSDLPVFAMFRKQRKSERSSPWHSTLLLLDRRTGAIAGRLEEVRGHAVAPPCLEGDVKQGTIHAVLAAEDTKSLVLKFGGTDASKPEPIQDDAAFPEEKKPGEEGTGDNAGSGAVRGLFKALFPVRSEPLDDEQDEQNEGQAGGNDPFG